MDTRLIKFIVFALTVLSLSGCGSDPPPQAPAQVSKSVVKTKTTPAASVVEEKEEVVEYVYSSIGKRDPFENPLQAIVDISSTEGIPLTPLQKFDLGQLRLIGVIVGRGDPRAMVVAPDGKSFILSVGTKVGKNNGSVTAITTEVVKVKEKYFDFAGEVKTSVQEIKLPKQGGVE